MPLMIQIPVILGCFALLWHLSRRRRWPDRPPGVFWNFWRNAGGSLGGAGWIFYAAAVALTATLVLLGWDDAFQRWLQRTDPLPRSVTWPAFVVGNLWTPAIGLSMLGLARRTGRARLRAGAAAGLQAVFSTFWIVTLRKTLSGRRGPAWLLEGPAAPGLHGGPFARADSAADFDLAFWLHGFGDGRFFWPSGHTATAVTMVSALVAFYPDKRWIAWAGYPLAAFMGLAMLDGDHHWLSDVVAGALIAHIIGWTIGKAFARLAGDARPAGRPAGR